MKWIVGLIIILLLPIIPTTHETVSFVEVEEQYTKLEPYSTYVLVREPVNTLKEQVVWQDDGSWDRYRNSVFFTAEESIKQFQAVTPGRWARKNYWKTEYRTVRKPITKYREVTRTRIVDKPIISKSFELVSGVQYVLGRR